MDHRRIFVRAGLIIITAVSCGGGTSGQGHGSSTPIARASTEFDFGSPLGPQSIQNWETPLHNGGIHGMMTLPADDGAIYPDYHAYPVSFAKQDKLGKVKWTTPVSFGGDVTQGFQANEQDFAMTTTADGHTFVVGSVYSMANAAGLGAALLGPDGTLVWAKKIDARPVQASFVALVAHSSGDFIFAAIVTNNASGSIDPVETNLYRVDATGNLLATVKIDPIHVSEYDRPGVTAVQSTTAETAPLGQSSPVIGAITATADGGFVIAGYYPFGRSILCGSEAAPKDPPSAAVGCRQNGADVMLRRYDSAMTEVWSKHYGDGFLTALQTDNVVELGNGTLIVTGLVYPHPNDSNPTNEALSLGVTADGTLRWLDSHPWGKAPGTRLFDGSVAFKQAVGTTATDAVFMMSTPKGSPCTLVRMGEDGAITGVEPLIPQVTDTANGVVCYGVAGVPGFLVDIGETLFRFDPVK